MLNFYLVAFLLLIISHIFSFAYVGYASIRKTDFALSKFLILVFFTVLWISIQGILTLTELDFDEIFLLRLSPLVLMGGFVVIYTLKSERITLLSFNGEKLQLITLFRVLIFLLFLVIETYFDYITSFSYILIFEILISFLLFGFSFTYQKNTRSNIILQLALNVFALLSMLLILMFEVNYFTEIKLVYLEFPMQLVVSFYIPFCIFINMILIGQLMRRHKLYYPNY